MSKYSAVIVGCGVRGKHHGQAFLANADRFRLVGLCDTQTERLQELAACLGVRNTWTDAEQMLRSASPDVLCFATQPHVRRELVELGVRHRVKAIAFEKPMALSVAEARHIRDLCDQAGVKVVVSHQHKYGPHWRKVREIVRSGELGQVHTIHATAKGWLLQYGTHLVDYMIFLNGGCRGRWVVGHVQGAGKLDDSHPSPDYVMGQIGFENGVRGILECGELAPDQPGDNSFWMNAGATVYGTQGYARVIVGTGWQAVTRSPPGLVSGSTEFDFVRDQIEYIRDLADWLDDPASPHPCNGDISCHGFELVMGMCLAGLENRKVDVPIDPDKPIIGRLRRELESAAAQAPAPLA